MKIIEYYYNDNVRSLYVEFSTFKDGDNFYRILNLPFNDVQYYSPSIINEVDMENITKNFIVEIINEYLKDNDLPEEKIL